MTLAVIRPSAAVRVGLFPEPLRQRVTQLARRSHRHDEAHDDAPFLGHPGNMRDLNPADNAHDVGIALNSGSCREDVGNQNRFRKGRKVEIGHGYSSAKTPKPPSLAPPQFGRKPSVIARKFAPSAAGVFTVLNPQNREISKHPRHNPDISA